MANLTHETGNPLSPPGIAEPGRSSRSMSTRRVMGTVLSFLLLSAIALPLATDPAFAQPSIKVVNKYYPITGRTAAQLRRAMVRNGPFGFWARTDWTVRWSGTCRVDATITYTWPKWTDKAQASASLRRSWDRMMVKLEAHEKNHGRHGINAAKEIKRTRCARNPHGIIRKWALQDRLYDKRTQHGIKEGIALP